MERLKNELTLLDNKLKELGAPMTYRNKIEDIRVSIRFVESKEAKRV